MELFKQTNARGALWLSIWIASVVGIIATASLLELSYTTAEPLTIVALGAGLLVSLVVFVFSLIKAIS